MALLVALTLLAAGCSGTRGSGLRRYSVTLHESQRASGLADPPDRTVTLNATTEQRNDKHDKAVTDVVFASADGQGEPTLVASTRAVSGHTFILDRPPGQGILGGYSDTSGARLQPAEAVLLFQLLVQLPQHSGPHQTRSVQLGAGVAQTVEDRVTGNPKMRGVRAEQVTTTLRADRRMPPMTAYVRLTSSYAADPAFVKLFEAPPSVAIPTTTHTVTIPGYTQQQGGFADVLGCLITFLLRCPPGRLVTVPPRQETTTTIVPGPASLVTTLGGSISLASSELVAQHDATLLTATGSGRMELSGSLPSGPGVPAAVAGKTVSIVSDVTYSTQLVSAWPAPERPGSTVPVQVAGVVALLLVCCVTATLGYRRLTARR